MFPWNLFPFNKDMKNMMQQMKPEEVDKYVQNIMGQMLPQQMQEMNNPANLMKGFNSMNSQTPSNSHALQSSTFETHDYVYIRIPIKKEEWLKNMKLYHTSNQMIIEHIPEFDHKHTIVLPALVKRKGSKSSYKDGMLEIKIPKNVDMQFTEIEVTDI